MIIFNLPAVGQAIVYFIVLFILDAMKYWKWNWSRRLSSSEFFPNGFCSDLYGCTRSKRKTFLYTFLDFVHSRHHFRFGKYGLL